MSHQFVEKTFGIKERTNEEKRDAIRCIAKYY